MTTSRRKFITSISMLAASSAMPIHAFDFGKEEKLKVVLVGTGVRGSGFWGKRLVDEYSDLLEFVGLCDINPGRLEYAKEFIGVKCKTYSDFEKMINKSKPDLVIVTTKDSTHHEYIIKGLEMGCDVLTEKPLTTDETKCQAILDAERKSDKKLIVGFNYRWSPYATKIKELLQNNSIGELTSVDFHWYLNTYHGASYFRRWHGQMESGGSLWVHKSTHHFDLLNWWIDSDPEEVFAYGDLEHYGKNGPFRGSNCRSCEHKTKCDYHWDITKDEHAMKLYANNEEHDGYIRDNCLFREEIDIYDKMSAQVKYKDNTVLNYSLTTYSPIEGWRVAFNGTEGRIEAWLDIPYTKKVSVDQEELHKAEMKQSGEEMFDLEPIIVHKNRQDFETIEVKTSRAGHGGGDKKLQDSMFRNTGVEDEFDRPAGIRDGAMSILIGIAARRSIEEKKPIKIGDLTDLVPEEKRLS
ncbi:Gfo/Idh/MocA family oxidoreductase [Aurantibacter crassamenti]|uniref:Gfo/Idh/MocA family oxidoreductase n=1 Tax=Aurantibacter crassamenti TaxID=1837375 RepID=UPI00193AC7A9|nr:Gfo/Idh/MocA family oxidoreductase [Aurantibacter crassamenti]MBM1106476.1 Gfo/Idh/MocA family oxidoreductase [Aurantibacter crassamenti]